MSLKVFHLFFISVSALLCAWVGAWGVRGFVAEGQPERLVLGVLFALFGIALVVYGTRFLRKARALGL